jgi:AraC family transcriptional regulator of adaptative response / DNA-3-methyladenine glycosylase II
MDEDAAYLAFAARDARFDGRLFMGVTSTGIYCRPICRVRTPQRRNCRFFATAAQAEAQAFRPCLKCRPEIAPGPGPAWSVMDASRTLALAAADRLVRDNAQGEDPGIAQIAAKLGVSGRHLRRIFVAEHGVTPLQFVQTRRLLLAKQLLADSALPMSQVAWASGFRSLRRFNAAFSERYRMSPSQLRRNAPLEPRSHDDVRLTLGYRPPYDAAALLRFFAQRSIPGIEVVDTGASGGALTVRRTVRAGVLSTAPGWIEAAFVPLKAQVRLRFGAAWAGDSARVIGAVRRWLDLDARPDVINNGLRDLTDRLAASECAATASEKTVLSQAAGAPQSGLRLPGSLDAFELAVRAVLGQQVTVAGARTLARRVVERYGEPLPAACHVRWPDLSLCFPAPSAIVAATADGIASLGIVRTRAAAIVALAQAWSEIDALLIAPAPSSPSSPDALITRLCALPGIGPWTAHYIAMRALGWADAFLPGDVALIKAMRRLHGDGLRPRDTDSVAQAWRPWRSYAVLHLWNSLENHP